MTTTRNIKFPDPVYEKLRERKDKTGQAINSQIKRAVAKEAGEL